MKELLFIVGTHGNELAPMKLFYDHPYGQTDKVRWEVVVANPRAVFRNQRFIDHDLNRLFGNTSSEGGWEAGLVSEIRERINRKKYDVVYDVHTSNDSKPFSFPDCAFINTLDQANIDALSPLYVDHIIWDSNPAYNRQYVTSCHPVGVTLEYQKTTSFQHDVGKVLNDFESIVYQHQPKRKQIVYEADRPVTQEEAEMFNLKLHDFSPLSEENRQQLHLPEGIYVPVFVNKKEVDPLNYCFLNRKVREL